MSLKRRSYGAAVVALVTALAMTACGESSPLDVESNEVEEPNGSDDPSGPALNFYEEELLGLWSRYHSYDGSTQYIRFDADRTACKWEEPSGSNVRTDESSYSSWSIDDSQSADDMAIQVSGAGITWHFDYPENEIWPEAYRSTLARRPSSESKTCQ